MSEDEQNELFGDFLQHDRATEDLYKICSEICRFPSQHEHERHYLLAAVRRTLSLNKAFRHAIESNNGQMAATLVRLNLDTLSRVYALYWADDTENMSAESFSMGVARGESIRSMRLRGSKSKATDRWLIEQIESLGDWIPEVYRRTSGAIHFSDFHISQMLMQATPVMRLDDGTLHANVVIGPGEKDAEPELYRELKQAYLHICLMLLTAIQQRCEKALA